MTELTYPKPEERNCKSEIGLVLVIALSVSVIVPSLLDIVVAAGNHFGPYPGEDLATDYVLGILWAATLGISILFWPVSSRDRRALLRIWLIKAIVALVLMLAYEYQYALDPDGYFTNAVAPDFIWEGFMFGNGTLTTQQLAWLHLKIVPGSYHAAKVGFALIGLVGVYFFYRAAVLFLRREDIRILYVLALFPGILFWSSILGKDPITLLGFSLYVYGVVAWHCLRQQRHLITFALGILIVSLIKTWLVPIIMAPLLVFIIIGRRSFIWWAMPMVICVLVLAIALPNFPYMWNISTIEELFEFRSYATGAFTGGGSSYESPEIRDFSESIRFLPFWIFTALFRPLPFEVPNLFGFLQSLENVVLLFLLVLAVKRTQLKELSDPIILWTISLILIWSTFYGSVAYNLGTLVRYKLQIYPIFLGLLLYLSRRRTKTILQADQRLQKN